MDAYRAPRSTTIATFCSTALLLVAAPLAWATPTFNCPGVRYIGNTSVTVPDPHNTATNCATSSDGAIVASDGTFSAVTGFFVSGWTLTTSVFGQLLRVSNAAGITWNLGPMPGYLTTVGSSPGQITQYTYNNLGRIESTTAPGALVTTYTYEPLSNRVQTADRMGNVTTYTYDAMNRPVNVIESSGSNQITYTYDSLSTRPSSATESTGGPPSRVTTYTYDMGNGNRLDTRTDTTAPTTTYTYDPVFNRVTSIQELPQPGGNRTTYDYDGSSNRVTMVTDDPPPPPVITQYHYDATSNLLTEVERDGTIITRFEYDSAGHLTGSIDDPNGQNRQTRFTYDALGHLSSITDPNGQSIGSFSYVPEPGSLLLLAIGLGALALRRRPLLPPSALRLHP